MKFLCVLDYPKIQVLTNFLVDRAYIFNVGIILISQSDIKFYNKVRFGRFSSITLRK